MKKEVKCKVCGYKWISRVEKPKKCAKCLRWINYDAPNRDRQK